MNIFFLAVFQESAGGTASTGAARLSLWGDFALSNPYFLLLVPVVLLATWWGRSRSGRATGRVSVLASDLPRSTRQKLLWIPRVCALCAGLLVVLALARPVRQNVEHADTSEGVDIVTVVDRSGSMQFDDMRRGSSRLDVVKEVLADFITRRTGDREGAADKVALLTFARFPELLCPFTLDAEALCSFLADIELVKVRDEDGTGIGIALAKAVAVLSGSEAKSRIVVLLTDGENNVDAIMPMEAAELAAEEGVKVYTVFAAKYLYVQDPFRGAVPTRQEPDTRELEAIAEMTDGRFFRARNPEELEQIYAEIEELERTPREQKRYEETFDLYFELLLPALLLYALAWLSDASWARRVL
ncbi:MAG: Ca-activated chloride channel family protein [Planctomycetota bacterium]